MNEEDDVLWDLPVARYNEIAIKTEGRQGDRLVRRKIQHQRTQAPEPNEAEQVASLERPKRKFLLDKQPVIQWLDEHNEGKIRPPENLHPGVLVGRSSLLQDRLVLDSRGSERSFHNISPQRQKTQSENIEQSSVEERKLPIYAGSYFDERERLLESRQSGDYMSQKALESPLGTWSRAKTTSTNRLSPSVKLSKDELAEYNLHKRIMENLKFDRKRKAIIALRREEIRKRMELQREKREFLEYSSGMHRHKMRSDPLWRHFAEMSPRDQFSETKRSYTHPEYDEAYQTFVDNNREKIILQQLHRERQRTILYTRKAAREIAQHQLGTIRLKPLKHKKPEKLDDIDIQALKELDVADKLLAEQPDPLRNTL